MTKIKQLGEKWRQDPEFQIQYDALEEEFALASSLIKARKHANMTQAELAKRMETSQTAIARLEGFKGNPSLKTLLRYAKATGTRLKITFEAETPKP